MDFDVIESVKKVADKLAGKDAVDRRSESVTSSPRAALLDEAKALITGDRNNQYGPPTQDFKRAADAMTAMGYRSARGRIQPHDVAILVTLVKISRLQWMPEKRDSWADIAGYAGCGWECVTENGDLPDEG